jgi:hypothetical protein
MIVVGGVLYTAVGLIVLLVVLVLLVRLLSGRL